ncbi:MAG: site-specific integrase [Bacteroidota bacterium]
MAKFNFNLRNPQSTVKESKQVKTPVNFLIRWDNKKLVFPTGLTILPKDWETDKTKGKKYQRAKSTLKEHPEFNSSLIRLEGIADKTFNRFVNEYNRQPTIKEYKDLLQKSINPTLNTKLDFFGYFDKFIKESEFKTNDKTKKPYSPATISIYKTALKHLKEYSKVKHKRIDFDTIDLDFYYSYFEYLTKDKMFSENNKGKLIKVIKTVLNDATERGINKNLSFRSKRFKVVSEDVENVYLDDSELLDLFNLDLRENNRLERVRDLFYIGCNTGLRFSDLSKVNMENIIDKQLHVKDSKKTGVSVVIPLKNEIFEILKRYDGRFPPSISNQKMNEYIKELCGMVESLKKKVEVIKIKNGLKVYEKVEKFKLISTHTARRSFATNCYKKNVPSIVIMGVTGHKTESSFLKYIKITSKEKADILQMYLNQNENLTTLKVI